MNDNLHLKILGDRLQKFGPDGCFMCGVDIPPGLQAQNGRARLSEVAAKRSRFVESIGHSAEWTSCSLPSARCPVLSAVQWG